MNHVKSERFLSMEVFPSDMQGGSQIPPSDAVGQNPQNQAAINHNYRERPVPPPKNRALRTARGVSACDDVRETPSPVQPNQHQRSSSQHGRPNGIENIANGNRDGQPESSTSMF